MNKGFSCLLLAALALSLAACSSVKQELGVGRHSPDEFLVVKNTPLTLPPDYALRPPMTPDEAAAAPTAASDAAGAAEETLLGKRPAKLAKKTSSDKALLDKIGTVTADPNIRQRIDQDNGYISLQNQTLADQIIFWDDEAKNEAPAPDSIPASVVDPKAEAERLKKNKREGKPANEGEVPVIEKKTGTIDKIF